MVRRVRRRCVCESRGAGGRKSKTSIGSWERDEDEEEEKHLDDEVSGWEKTRQREKDKKWGNERRRGKECEECTQIQGTLTHNHGNQALNFNPSCSRYHGHLSIRTLPPLLHTHHPILWPFIGALDPSSWKRCNYQAVAAAMTSTFTFSLVKVSALEASVSRVVFFSFYLTSQDDTSSRQRFSISILSPLTPKLLLHVCNAGNTSSTAPEGSAGHEQLISTCPKWITQCFHTFMERFS